MGVKPRLTANFVQKFAKKYSRLVEDVTFQGEFDLWLIAVDMCQRQKHNPNYKFGGFFLQLTFWFDCGGQTGCQMRSVFDALWVEYSRPNCFQFNISWSKNRRKPNVGRLIWWLEMKKMGFFHFFRFLSRVGRFFFTVEIHVRPSWVLDHLIHLGKTNWMVSYMCWFDNACQRYGKSLKISMFQ